MKTAIILAAAATLTLSCRTTKKTVSETEKVELSERTIEIRDTVLVGWNFTSSLPITEVQQLPIGKTIYISDTSGRGSIRLLRDSLGNLQITCAEKDQVIEKLRREMLKNNLSHHSNQVSKEQKKGFFESMWPILALALGFIVVIIGILLRTG